MNELDVGDLVHFSSYDLNVEEIAVIVYMSPSEIYISLDLARGSSMKIAAFKSELKLIIKRFNMLVEHEN